MITIQAAETKYFPSALCAHCCAGIPVRVHEYSVDKFGDSLCYCCQEYLRGKKIPSKEAFRLYLSLRRRLVPVELEKFDGYKTIDMVITDSKVNIEVDGMQHYTNSAIGFTDLLRTEYSLRGGYLTLRIPNLLVNTNLEETANIITRILNGRSQGLSRV
jgi:very-short-patch-repair endonuclease